MTFPDPRPLRLLVIRYRFIGDTVLAIPFLRNLRRAFPHATIDALVEPVAGETLVPCPYENNLRYYAPRLTGEARARSIHPTSLFACARMLRRNHYDRVYILRRSFSSAILAILSGIPHRVGFATEGRRWLLQRSTPYAAKHEVECFLDVLRADGIPVVDTSNENWSDPATDHRVDAALCASGRHRVFFCTKSVDASKNWTAERFGQIAAWLIGERHCEIHFCDARENAAYIAEILAAIPVRLREHCHDWSRELTLRDVNSLLRRIDLAFGIDTGLIHVAASFHIPVVVLFGFADPRRWHPWDTAYTILQPKEISGATPLVRLSIKEAQDALQQYLNRFDRPSAARDTARIISIPPVSFADLPSGQGLSAD